MGIVDTTRPTITEELMGMGAPQYSHPDPQAHAEGLRDYALNANTPAQSATQMDIFIQELGDVAGAYASHSKQLDRVLVHLRGEVPEKEGDRVADPHPESESVFGRLHSLLDDIKHSRDKMDTALSELQDLL